MRSRYPETKVSSYCYHPIHVVDDTKDIYVPCGKCDGCRLHKANEWSMRVGNEIECNPFSIFFSLTYSNKFLPRLLYDPDKRVMFSDHVQNIRFDGTKVVRRKDDLVLSLKKFIPARNLQGNYLPYASKRDIILWLKLIRKNLIENGFTNRFDVSGKPLPLFRYFIISEYGPTTYRPHFHGLIFPSNEEISAFILERCIFPCWQMCDEDRVQPYVHYCDSGARGYVTQYLTMSADLPAVYKCYKELAPFRLSSKSPSIGSTSFVAKEVFQNVSQRIMVYSKQIARLGVKAILSYPSYYGNSLFPKCFRYGVSSSQRIQFVYGCLLRATYKGGYPYFVCSSWFRALLHPLDYAAAKAAYKFCYDVRGLDYFLYTLDMYYYLRSMSVLRKWYEEQQTIDLAKRPYDFLLLYDNLNEFVFGARFDTGTKRLAFQYFFEPLGIFDPLDLSERDIYQGHRDPNNVYQREVSSIVQSMVKESKYNEFSGNCPYV